MHVSPEILRQIERGRRPAYAFLPQLADRHLVVDLDRIMTVEKAMVLSWTRAPGCATDVEARAFAQALARKRARFAFPDDFTFWVKKLALLTSMTVTPTRGERYVRCGRSASKQRRRGRTAKSRSCSFSSATMTTPTSTARPGRTSSTHG